MLDLGDNVMLIMMIDKGIFVLGNFVILVVWMVVKIFWFIVGFVSLIFLYVIIINFLKIIFKLFSVNNFVR